MGSTLALAQPLYCKTIHVIGEYLFLVRPVVSEQKCSALSYVVILGLYSVVNVNAVKFYIFIVHIQLKQGM